MRNSFCWFNIIILSLVTFNTLGQQVKYTKFDISLVGGSSLPVGSYGNKSPSKSAIYVNGSQVKGFAKGKSGFAKMGYYYNAEIKYKLSSSLKLLILIDTYSNPIETDGMSDFMTQLYGNKETKVEEESYRFFYINPGVGYYYSLNKFDFGFNIFMGYSITNFPYYKVVYLFSMANPPLIFAHVGPRPNLDAFTLGTSLSATYHIFNRFRIGIDVLYQRANFAYNMSPELIPGGGGANLTFSDILKVRVLNTGLKIGYCF
ncbi:MAG: hypothetical protein EPN88_08320 [Bacteroidetes bacterium]|nr:MAG: hypothetical protein EPN88_08320 [Bacteroidota bacterium]